LPTIIFIDILAGILIVIGIIFLITAFNKNFLAQEFRGKKYTIAGRAKKLQLVSIGFLLLIVSAALLLFY